MPVTYDEIITYTVPSNTGSVTLGSGGQGTIPQTYTDLICVVTSKDTRVNSGVDDLTCRWNGYTSGYAYGVINNAGGFRGSGQTGFPNAHPGNSDQPSTSYWHFADVRNTNKNKQVTCWIGSMYGNLGNPRLGTCNSTQATAAITSITFIGEQGIAAGSVFKLYGIAEA